MYTHAIERGIAFEKISSDDFYRKSQPFSLYLRQRKDRSLDELSSNKAKRAFRKFVKAWNKAKLDVDYYDEAKVKAKGRGNEHRWNFSKPTPVIGPTFPSRGVSCTLLSMSMTLMPTLDSDDEREFRENQSKLLRKEQKEYSKQHEMVLEELVPKKEGR